MANKGQMHDYHVELTGLGRLIARSIGKDVREGGEEFLRKAIDSGEKILLEMKKIFSSNVLDKEDNASLDFEMCQVRKQIKILQKFDLNSEFTYAAVAYIMATSQVIRTLADKNNIEV